MPKAGRLGDRAEVPSDSHGCPSCPHDALGPAISGSATVLINRKPALRLGDSGTHASCCGANTWSAAQGSSSVIINGRPSHRFGDCTSHCGGTGSLIEGSPDVIIGDTDVGKSEQDEPPEATWISLSSLDENGMAIPYQPIRIEVGGQASIALTGKKGVFKVQVIKEDAEIMLGLLARDDSDDIEDGTEREEG